ncbi:MAG: DUF1820 family protein [Gammaproteobacteria bacterium]|nr:DUF1820 family protein [Gammaproteobacteria bacterium]
MATKHTYKVIFHNQGKVYEIFARAVHQSNLYGFIEVEKVLFGEKSSIVLDPSEEHLKSEFNGVSRSYIPIHAIIRIDEVDRQGHGKITEVSGDKVTALPIYTPGEPRKA